MSVEIDGKPDSGFDDPIGLLSDCHRRVERFLGGLVRVSTDLRGGALDQRYRKALEMSLHYFAEAAPRHTADEEHSLFPRMRASSDPRAEAAMERVVALEADHRDAEPVHAEVDVLGRRWLDAGTLGTADAARLAELLDGLQEMYLRHIAVEDEDVFPVARAVLSADDLAAVGREMALRRGLYGGLPLP